MIHSIADITSDGTKKPLSAVRISAVWVQVQAKSSNNASGARIGDVNIGATQGAILLPNNAQFFPACSSVNHYDLSQIYQLATTGDVFEIIYDTV